MEPVCPDQKPEEHRQLIIARWTCLTALTELALQLQYPLPDDQLKSTRICDMNI